MKHLISTLIVALFLMGQVVGQSIEHDVNNPPIKEKKEVKKSNQGQQNTSEEQKSLGSSDKGLIVEGGFNLSSSYDGHASSYHSSNFGNAFYGESNSNGFEDGGATAIYSRTLLSGFNITPLGNINAGAWGNVTGEGNGGFGIMASHGEDWAAPDTYAALGGEDYSGLFMGGNVGIATTTPSAPLHIATNNESLRLDGTSAWMSFYDGATYKGYLYHQGLNMTLSNQLAGNMIFRTSGLQRVIINSAGDVGIGIANPDSKLHIVGGVDASLSADGYLMNGSKTGLNMVFDENEIIARSNGTAADLYLQKDGGRLLIGESTPVQVGIGDVSPDTELHMVHAPGFGSHGLTVQCTTPSTGHWTIYADASASKRLFFLPDGSTSPDAHVEFSTGNWVPTSDERLKKNIEPVSNLMSSIMLLNPTKYHMNDQNEAEEKTFGLLAQEAKEVFPGIVNYIEEADQYGLSYTELIPIIIAGMQEQQTTIDQQQTIINSVQTENEMLKEKLSSMEAAIEAIREEIK